MAVGIQEYDLIIIKIAKSVPRKNSEVRKHKVAAVIKQTNAKRELEITDRHFFMTDNSRGTRGCKTPESVITKVALSLAPYSAGFPQVRVPS